MSLPAKKNERLPAKGKQPPKHRHYKSAYWYSTIRQIKSKELNYGAEISRIKWALSGVHRGQRMTSYDNIPEELKILPNWVCHDSNKKPIDPITGKGADANNKNTWSKFETAKAAVDKGHYAGIGFQFSESPYCGVDIDHCVDPLTGELSDLAKEIIDALDSYTEFSPSGEGVHIICRGSIPKGARKNSTLGIEMYDSGRYFTMTGDVVDEIE